MIRFLRNGALGLCGDEASNFIIIITIIHQPLLIELSLLGVDIILLRIACGCKVEFPCIIDLQHERFAGGSFCRLAVSMSRLGSFCRLSVSMSRRGSFCRLSVSMSRLGSFCRLSVNLG